MTYKVTQGSPDKEVGDFLNTISETSDFFTEEEPLIVTRAPGRLDVMGGIADYSGSLVLQLPIAQATCVALQKSNSSSLRILSLGSTSDTRSIEINLDELPTEYEAARQHFSDPNIHWASYIAGAFLLLRREKNLPARVGAAILISSNVPEGKGVSSSAALEVSVMQAVNAAFDLDLSAQEIGRLCQRVENLIAGAPSGIMDQMTSACGEQDRLLELLCQPDILKGTLRLPNELEVWGIDSGVRHSVSGSDYGTVRTAAFMGYRIICELAGLETSSTAVEGIVSIVDPFWNGYLANVSPAEFDHAFSPKLPELMKGSEFLERYEGTTDSVTTVKPDREYPIRVATRHPIYENARVTTFASILKSWQGIDQAARLGELMMESHGSYSDCGLGSEATDLIVDLVKHSTDGRLFGGRITGGGSGGTVAVLGRRGSNSAIEKVRNDFLAKTGYLPLVISGSSPGAGTFNHLRLEP